MISNSYYGEAAVEVLNILNFVNQEDMKKIPQSFINFLSGIASNTYKFEFDYNKSINELNLKEETKELLGFMYINWWCDEKQRNVYKQKIKELSENSKSKSKLKVEVVNDVFSNKNREIKKVENIEIPETSLTIENKEKGFFKKILDKIFLKFKN